MLRRSFVASLLMLAACGEDPTLTIKVTDVWGNPIPGMKVTIAGKGSASTNEMGQIVAPLELGEYKFQTHKDGYIDFEGNELTVKSLEAHEVASIEVYPEPKENGFWLVGAKSYEKLEGQTVVTKGNDVTSFYGIASDGAVEGPTKGLRLIYHNDQLKMDEVMRMGFELQDLNYVATTEVTGPEGKTDVPVNLWTEGKKQAITFEKLGSDRNYLVKTKDGELPSGSYAFETQDLLSPSDLVAFSRIPEALRVVYPFRVK
jgi:hypothetical protein